jgi:hypothetical protein
MSVVPGQAAVRERARAAGLWKVIAAGAMGLLIRSGDGDLFGQTAARPPARTCDWGSCRRAAAGETGRGLIIAVASRR